MADANQIVAATNQKLISGITNLNLMNILGWGLFLVIIIGGSVYGYIIWRNRRIFNKKITVFDIVGINFVPSLRDVAKTVKIGTGGFEILFLKKLKIFRIAYGGKVGKDTYYFFILPDGYWFNGMLSADMMMINKNGGLIPVVTTNPTMRSQYTSLEKQIDSLQQSKATFMEKYGAWVMGIAFVMIAGVFLWLNYREFSQVSGSMSGLVDKIANLVDKVAALQGGSANNNGLIPLK